MNFARFGARDLAELGSLYQTPGEGRGGRGGHKSGALFHHLTLIFCIKAYLTVLANATKLTG